MTLQASSVLLRTLGALVLALALLPGHRLLDPRNAGLAGSEFIRLAPGYTILSLVGTGIAAVVAGVAVLALGAPRIHAVWASVVRLLTRPRAGAFAFGAGVLGFAVTAVFAHIGLDGGPALLDAASQLLHARYLAAGVLAGPQLPAVEFWDFQYMLETPAGWVSQYPPGHVLMLAAGTAVGAVWLVGPLLMGVLVGVTCLIGEEVFGEDSAAARLGGLLTGSSAFLIGLAGSHMNHVTAALGAAVAVYAGLRAARGGAGWGVLAGGAIGLTVVTRPLFGLVMGLVATFGPWWAAESRVRSGAFARRAGAVLAGGLPWAVFLFFYNARFFDSPFRFGYMAAQGPSHGLGFHVDPWGAFYGPVEAIGYTAIELRALGVELLQTPVPVVVLVAVYAMWIARIPRRARVLLAWAVLPVVANVFYWHHDLVFGPRMLNETAPAWILLGCFAAFGLVRRLSGEGEVSRSAAWLGATLAVSLLIGLAVMSPFRLSGYGLQAARAGWSVVPPNVLEPSVVFVHGSWQGRLGARLVATGLPADSVRTALAVNATCAIQEALDGGRARSLSFTRPGRVTPRPLPSGAVILTAPGENELTETCRREVDSDRDGTFGLPQLVWRGDLPGLPARGALYVRDMGPERNRVVLDAFPERTPLVFVPPVEGAQPSYRPYDEGMERLWGTGRADGSEGGG